MKLCILAALTLPIAAFAQEGTYSISAPVVVSGAAESAHDSGGDDSGTRGFAGVHATIAPSLQLGAHWFFYSLADIRSSDYLPYSEYDHDPALSARLSQGYIGYKRDFANGGFLLKAGRLASAFGSYPLQYDDAKTALINPPPSYLRPLPLRPNQRICDLDDLLDQDYGGAVMFHCGGAPAPADGLVPVTLYGIPAVEAQLSWKRTDARVQMTNSSPSNPQSLLSASQALQWTTGAGYSFHNGLRTGFSQFRGPYLTTEITPTLPPGSHLHDYNASGLGIDWQWSHAAWAIEGEWQIFHFDLPGFEESPSQQAAYVQIKRILSPHYYAALRSSWERPGSTRDGAGEAIDHFQQTSEAQELVFGWWLNHLQLLKLGLQYSNWSAWSYEKDVEPARRQLGIQLQLVTSFNGLSKTF
jgi:hypothetical protein